MKKILIPLMIVSFSMNALAVSSASVGVATASATMAASRNKRLQEQQRLNQQRLEKISRSTDGIISGVFICKAHKPKTKGYYAIEYTKCDFWSNDDGYFSLDLSEIPEKFFPGRTVTNIFLNTHKDTFEFYYR